MRQLLQRTSIATLLWALSVPALALDEATLKQLAGDTAAKIEAIGKITAAGDATAIPVLQALQDGALHTTPEGVVVIVGDTTVDAASGKPVTIAPDQVEKITINNRVRGELDTALAALRLFAPDAQARAAAAQELLRNADAALLPLVERALAKETDAEIKTLLVQGKATIQLRDPDPAVRLAAIKALGDSRSAAARQRLAALLEKTPDGGFAEPDAEVRKQAERALGAVERRFVIAEVLAGVFSGLSLGSILLLAALGLAITFGLMGIINMAHGELLMIGAYTTFVVQTVFKTVFPESFDFYLLAAVPAAFAVSAVVGMAMERGVIRYLYGRPLETLLATWGISLILIQLVRTMFGAQNVEVANPSWMSGGFSIAEGVVLPYNRIVIILFASFVVFLVWILLNRTRLGLFVRAVTQNRAMADCVGISTPRVDLIAFGLGSGIAGLGGCALSQIGNVGPELGQSYIVDSFMVVVLGGVGQLAGTVVAAMGLGEVNKFLEPYAGAVLAKIMVLVFIIIFIQKRPQGLFALKGRTADN